jgi:hypothetical protein
MTAPLRVWRECFAYTRPADIAVPDDGEVAEEAALTEDERKRRSLDALAQQLAGKLKCQFAFEFFLVYIAKNF